MEYLFKSSRVQAFNRTVFGFLFLTLGLLNPLKLEPLFAQAKIAKIGWLAVRPASAAAVIASFKRELAKLGYVDGKNVTFEYRFAEGKLDRLPALAEELVRLKVDVLIGPNTPAALALKNATKIIPIVFIDVTDPIAAGLVDSLARPGGNI